MNGVVAPQGLSGLPCRGALPFSVLLLCDYLCTCLKLVKGWGGTFWDACLQLFATGLFVTTNAAVWVFKGWPDEDT